MYFLSFSKKLLRVPNEYVNISKVETDYPLAAASAMMVEWEVLSFGNRGMVGYTISQGLSQEEEKRKDILNITLGKDQKQTVSSIYSFAVEPWDVIPKPYSCCKLTTLVSRKSERELHGSASLLSFQGESFYSVRIIMWNTHFWCAWERKKGWIKCVGTASPYSTRQPLQKSTCKNVNVCKKTLQECSLLLKNPLLSDCQHIWKIKVLSNFFEANIICFLVIVSEVSKLLLSVFSLTFKNLFLFWVCQRLFKKLEDCCSFSYIFFFLDEHDTTNLFWCL